MKIIKIEDREITQLDIYARFSDSQLLHCMEPEPGLFIVESANVILRALRAGYEPLSLLVDSRVLEVYLQQNSGETDFRGKSEDEKSVRDRINEISINGEIADVLELCRDLPIYTAPVRELSRLVGFKLTGGILCAMKRGLLKSPEEICRTAQRIAVLERVMNPINVGAIFRSAAALGMDAVLLTPGSADPLYRRSARVGMGTVFQVPWTYLGNTNGWRVYPGQEDYCCVDKLHEMGFHTAAMALCEDTLSIEDPRLLQEERLAVIMGTEGDGLSQNTIQKSDYTIKIPMANGVDSLNVAAASAIAFWELGRTDSSGIPRQTQRLG